MEQLIAKLEEVFANQQAAIQRLESAVTMQSQTTDVRFAQGDDSVKQALQAMTTGIDSLCQHLTDTQKAMKSRVKATEDRMATALGTFAAAIQGLQTSQASAAELAPSSPSAAQGQPDPWALALGAGAPSTGWGAGAHPRMGFATRIAAAGSVGFDIGPAAIKPKDFNQIDRFEGEPAT